MRPIILVLLAAATMWAQQRSGRPAGPVVGAGPGPSAGRIGQGPGNVLRQPGRPPVAIPGNREYRHRGGVVGVPYPVVIGGPYYGGFGYGYGPGYYPPPDAGYDATYAPDNGYMPQQAPPVVVINQNFEPDTVHPVVRDYSNAPLPEPTLKKYENSSHPYENQRADQAQDQANNPNGLADDQPTIFLLAMKDHSILPSIAYWVQGSTLNYVTVDGHVNRVSMDLVDRDFSKQLNDERHVEFKLPVAK